MAQSVKIAGALFSNVPSIQVPDENDVFHPFVDPSPTTATASDVASGKIFFAADGTQTSGTASGGSATIVSKTITSNGTYNASADSADGYDPVIVNVPGGLPLLATETIGYLSNVSTSATSTGKAVVVPIEDTYDYLLYVAYREEGETTGYHLASFCVLECSYTNGGHSLTGATLKEITNAKSLGSGDVRRNMQTANYGVFPATRSFTTSSVTLNISARRNDTQTGTIDGNYTAKVYGIKAYTL